MNLNLQKTSDGVRIGLTGDLSGPEAATFADAFKAQVPEGSVATVDFSAVENMDIEGLRKLITVDRWLKGRGGKLVLSGVNGEILKLLQANGVQSMFEISAGNDGGAPPAATSPTPAPGAWQPPTPASAPAPATPPPPPRAAPPPVVSLPEETAAWAPKPSDAPARPAPPEAPSAWEKPAAPAPAPPPVRKAPALPPTPPPADAWSAQATSPVPAADAWTAPASPAAPPTPPPAGDAWTAPTPSPAPPPALAVPDLPADNSAWSTPGATPGAGKQRAAKDPSAKKGGAGLWIGLAALLAAGGAGAGWWFFLRKGDPPAITAVTPQGTELSLEPGTLPDFRISASNADEITADGPALPGLVFKATSYQGTVTGIYTGTVDGGTGQPLKVTFTASRGDLHSESRTITFNTRAPVIFDQVIFFPEAGKPFDGRIVTAAESVTVDGKPAWMELISEESDGKKVWSLRGTPTGPEKLSLKISATGTGGSAEQQVVSVNVKPAAAEVAVVDNPPTIPPEIHVDPTPPEIPPTPPGTDPPVIPPTAPDPTPQTPPTPPVRHLAGQVPVKLRNMIRDRMDAMSTTRLSPELRQQINAGLEQMEAADVVASVSFATGGSELTSAAEAKLGDALANSAPLLEAKNRQIIVIGYASPSGDATKNLILSRARADAVSSFLNTKGYAPRMSDGYGETKVVSNRDSANQAVEIYVMVPNADYVDPLDQLAAQMSELRRLMVAEEAK